MMYTPHPTLFVLRPLKEKPTRALPDALRAIEGLGALAASGPKISFGEILEWKSPSHAKENNERFQETLRGEYAVEPVLVDEQERLLFPTGEIMIRFHRALTTKQLNAFAKEHGLTLIEKNEFIKEQVKFQVAASTQESTLQVIERLQKDEQIERVWPVTFSSYQREERRGAKQKDAR